MKTTRPIPSGRQQTLAQDVSRLARDAMIAALEQAAGSGRRRRCTSSPRATATAPRQMAAVQSDDAAHAGATRRDVRSLPAQLSKGRPRPKRRRGVDDVGAAMAMFVAVNLQALHGEEVERRRVAAAGAPAARRHPRGRQLGCRHAGTAPGVLRTDRDRLGAGVRVARRCRFAWAGRVGRRAAQRARLPAASAGPQSRPADAGHRRPRAARPSRLDRAGVASTPDTHGSRADQSGPGRREGAGRLGGGMEAIQADAPAAARGSACAAALACPAKCRSTKACTPTPRCRCRNRRCRASTATMGTRA